MLNHKVKYNVMLTQTIILRDDDLKDLISTSPLPNEVIGNSFDFGCGFSTSRSLLLSWGIVVSIRLCFFYRDSTPTELTD